MRRYDIRETPADGAFDGITSLAARLFGVPIAIVSIVDEDRIWFKSAQGVDVRQVPRSAGLCSSAILQDAPYVLGDARLDAVALTNPLVAGDFGLRFYAAVPLKVASGHNLGTLCIIDRKPRELDDNEIAILRDLAGLVTTELDLRLATRLAVIRESELREEAESQRVLAQELTTALQASLLPLTLPEIPGIELAARFEPADSAQVGGDFYDVFALPEGVWGVVIADVCGKGPRAAAFSAAVRYALRSATIDHKSPARVLEVVNETLLLAGRPIDQERFCTLVYARLDPVPGGFEVTLACGGHPLPWVVCHDAQAHAIGTPGSLVGVLPSAKFTDASAQLGTGDTLLLFTDGLSEARSGKDLLGLDGLAACLAEDAELSPQDLVDSLAKTAGAGKGPMRDDLALIAIRVNDAER